MTRINTIDPRDLTDQHLMAEYREITRLPSNVQRSGGKATIPATYRMGTGHVTYFYNKAEYLRNRYAALCDELRRRNYDINPYEVAWDSMAQMYQQVAWQPTVADHAVNLERLYSKLETQTLTYYKDPINLQTYRILLGDNYGTLR